MPVKADRQIKVLADHLCRPLQDAADSLQSIADSLQAWVTLEQQKFAKENPHIEVRPVTVGQAKYKKDEGQNPESEGDLFPETVGPREARYLSRQAKQARRSA